MYFEMVRYFKSRFPLKDDNVSCKINMYLTKNNLLSSISENMFYRFWGHQADILAQDKYQCREQMCHMSGSILVKMVNIFPGSSLNYKFQSILLTRQSEFYPPQNPFHESIQCNIFPD